MDSGKVAFERICMDVGIVDFVVLWVDGNDLAWQKEKSSYLPEKSSDVGVNRYRDWDNLVYWFRSVAKYAPWVNKIHFVTNGQLPEWLDTSHPKIHHVKHSDYMPIDSLPTFNSSAIEIALHKIPELADRFVHFNDDIFLNRPITEAFFFRNNLPVDMPGLTRKCYSDNEDDNSTFSNLLHNNLAILNQYFNRNEVLMRHFFQWFNPSYGKTFIRTLMNLNQKEFEGIVIPHLAVPYRRSDFERVWEKCGNRLEKVQYNRFRDNTDLSHLLYRYWRLCEGDYYAKSSQGEYISLIDIKSAYKAAEIIRRQKEPVICINDCWESAEYQDAKDIINNAFDSVLGEKCEYEK